MVEAKPRKGDADALKQAHVSAFLDYFLCPPSHLLIHYTSEYSEWAGGKEQGGFSQGHGPLPMRMRFWANRNLQTCFKGKKKTGIGQSPINVVECTAVGSFWGHLSLLTAVYHVLSDQLL